MVLCGYFGARTPFLPHNVNEVNESENKPMIKIQVKNFITRWQRLKTILCS